MSAYDIVKDTILERLQNALDNNESFRWIKPWGSLGEPRNYVTKKPYKGINLLLLPFGGYYLTYKQVVANGGKVISGSRSVPIFFWSFSESKSSKTSDDIDKEEEVKKKAIFKYYRGFHQSCIEGIEFDNVSDKTEKVIETINSDNFIAEDMIKRYDAIVPIENLVVDRAFYSPSDDKIVTPKKEMFSTIEQYYGTVFHEIVHSTGVKERLCRYEGNDAFGSTNYSKEELVAEIGASIFLAHCNIESNVVDDNTIAYLQSWLTHIRGADSKEITIAAQRAQKAFGFVLDNIADSELNVG